MLIDLTVENYRSIKEPVTLSAVAQSRNTVRTTNENSRRRIKSDSDIAPAFPIEGRSFELLPVLGIFGANASGKSNVIKALNDLLQFMTFGSGQERDGLRRFVSFRLDKVCAKSPACFRVQIALNQTTYSYSLRVDQNRVFEERLSYIPSDTKRVRLLYHRLWNQRNSSYGWSNGHDFRGPHTQIEKGLKSDEPFISLLSRELEVDVIKELSRWLWDRWSGITLGWEKIDHYLASRIGHELPGHRDKATQIVRLFDTGLTDIQIRKSNGENDGSKDDEYDVIAFHETKEGRIQWSFQEESIGTQRLFALAHRILFAFSEATPLVIDELGSNLHPNITRAIVRMFQDPQTNPKRAQLIFTSHDNTLQRGNLLRRDQIWFTQKRPDGSTELYPLSDFKPRNDLAIDKAYLDGRFGAVPILPADDDLLATDETLGT